MSSAGPARSTPPSALTRIAAVPLGVFARITANAADATGPATTVECPIETVRDMAAARTGPSHPWADGAARRRGRAPRPQCPMLTDAPAIFLTAACGFDARVLTCEDVVYPTGTAGVYTSDDCVGTPAISGGSVTYSIVSRSVRSPCRATAGRPPEQGRRSRDGRLGSSPGLTQAQAAHLVDVRCCFWNGVGSGLPRQERTLSWGSKGKGRRRQTRGSRWVTAAAATAFRRCVSCRSLATTVMPYPLALSCRTCRPLSDCPLRARRRSPVEHEQASQQAVVFAISVTSAACRPYGGAVSMSIAWSLVLAAAGVLAMTATPVILD